VYTTISDFVVAENATETTLGIWWCGDRMIGWSGAWALN